MKINIFRGSQNEIVKMGFFLLNLMALHDKIQKYQIFLRYLIYLDIGLIENRKIGVGNCPKYI